MARCSFAGCPKPAHSKGLCGSHYAQQRVGKPLTALQVQFHGLSELERFEKRVTKHEGSCWMWTGAYLRAKDRPMPDWHGFWRSGLGKPEITSRAAWRLYVGPIPSGNWVLHRCDNPRCVNPAHLFLGTPADNVSDMHAKGRARQGHVIGERHGMAKLTADMVREIRASKDRQIDLAERFGVSRTCISDVQRRVVWQHIEGD